MFTHACYFIFVLLEPQAVDDTKFALFLVTLDARRERESMRFDVVSSMNYGVVSTLRWSDIVEAQIGYHKY